MTGTPGNPTRILIVDDHPLVRECLAELVNREPDLCVCGQAECANGALAAIAAGKPELAIIDLTLKDSHGLDLLKDIRIQYPKLRTLVISMHDESLYAARVMRAGAGGYMTKQEATRNIIRAIRAVLAGEVYLSARATTQLLRGVTGRARGELKLDVKRLSDRELQVFEAVGRGLTTRAIAEQLRLDVKTVETHRGRIREKLGLTDGRELSQYAAQWLASN